MGVTAASLLAVVSVSGADKAKSDLEGVGGTVQKVGSFLATGLVSAAVDAGKAVVGFGVQSVQAAGDYQQSLTSLVTGAGETQSNLQMVGDGILKIANQTGTTTKQLTDGMYMIESAGFHGAAGLSVLQAAAEGAKVGNADLGVVASATTTLMHDYSSSNITASQAVSALVTTVASGKTHMQDLASSLSSVLPLASSLHIPFEQVAGAMATMTNAGMSAQNASHNLANAIRSLNVESGPGAKALTAIGLSAEQVHNTLVNQGLPAALQMVEDYIGKKWPLSSLEGQSALKAIMGGATGLNVALMIGGSHMKEYQSDIDAIGSSLRSSSKDVQGWSAVQQDFNFKLARAKEALETLSISIGTKLLPIVGMAVDYLSNLAGQAQEAFDVMWSWLQAKVVPILINFWTWIEQYIIPALEKFWTWLTAKIITALKDLWTWFQVSIIPVLQQFWNWILIKVVPALQEMWRWIQQNVIPALQSMWAMILNNVISALQSMWKWIQTFVIPALTSLWNWIQTFVIPALQSMWKWINDNVVPALQQLAQWIMDHVVLALQSMWKWINDSVVPALSSMWGWIANNLIPSLQRLEDWINNHVVKALQSLAHWLSQNGTISVKTNIDAGGKAANPFQDIGIIASQAMKIFSQLGQALQKDVEPYIKDIKNDFDNLKGSLNELGNSFSQFINSFTGGKGNINWFKAMIGGLKLDIADLVFLAITPFLIVMNTLSTIFSGLATDIDGLRITWHGLNDTVKDFEKTISDLFNNNLKALPKDLQNLGNDLNKTWSGIWQTMVGTTMVVLSPLIGWFTGMVQGIQDLMQGLSDTLVGHSIIPDMINSIVSWFAQLPGRILGGIANFISQVASNFTNLAANALSWGSDMISNFSAGIANAAGGLIAQAQNVASQVASYLHFSNPDRGPLADAPKWMPDMMELLASGMNQNLGKIKSASLNVATSLSSNLQGVPATSLGNNTQPVQVVVQPAPIYIDGRTLASALMPYQADLIRYSTGVHNI